MPDPLTELVITARVRRRVRPPFVIRCATGSYTLGAYCRAWRAVYASAPGQLFNQSLCSEFGHFTREEILRQFRAGIHDRINRHVADYGEGRKWDENWQRECYHISRDLNSPRLVIHWLPQWLRARFGHRLHR